MGRPDVRQPHDWLRPTRPLIRQRLARPDLLPRVTNPGARDLFWSTAFSMALGALVAISFLLAIAR